MDKEQLEREMKRLINEIALSATLTCNTYAKAKELSAEIGRQSKQS